MRALITALAAVGMATLCSAQVSPVSPASPGSPAGPAAPVSKEAEEISKELGSLADSLILAISMDDYLNGSEVFSRPPAPANAMFFAARFVQDEGRQCASFANPPTSLMLTGILNPGPQYTLATWAKFPFAGEGAAVWDGIRGTPLFVKGNQFMSSSNGMEYALGEYNKALPGWHHLALTCDGNTTSLYVDGVINGTAPVAIEALVRTIGTRTSNMLGNSQCDLLDDMYVFNRALALNELGTLARAQLPKHGPSVGTVPTISSPANFPGSPNFPQIGSSSNPTNSANKPEAAELLRTYSNSLVFVTGNDGAGSGFIADMGGKPFLITNAHVAAGVRGATFRTLQGTPVTVKSGVVAVGHDIFALQAQTVDTPIPVMRDVGEKASIGDEVVVLGNAEGGGVINTIMGHIVGLGPNLVEIDAPFQPGNSGSPIIHLKSKKAIGVATYLIVRKYDTATNAAIKEPVIRRFGYRIDSVKTWQPVDWKAFYAQAEEMESIEKLTKDFITLIQDIGDDAKVVRSKHTNPVIRNRIDAWLAGKNKHMSPQDMRNADQNFISFLRVSSQSDVTAARQHLSYDYFQRQLADQQSERTEIAGIFAKIIESVRQER